MTQKLYDNNEQIFDESTSINIIQNDLKSFFSDQKELDSNATVQSQLTVETPKTKPNPLGTESNYLDEYRKSLLKSTDIAERYHFDEISTVKKLISNVLSFMWCVGIASILITTVFIGLKLNIGAITTTIFGTLLETIIGYIIKVLNDTLRTKEKFFEKDIEMQKYDKVLGLILTVPQDDRKTDLIEKVIDSYLNENNKNN